jgi:catechol 2,3-dioxygenase-like lactoylglutathione lyase family enzyme
MQTVAPITDARAPCRSNRELAIHVPDLARAKDFYCDVLGFRLLSEDATMLEIDTGELLLYVLHNSNGLLTYIPSFDVPDYNAARRQLEAAGCTAVPAGSHSTDVYFQDPFGFTFDIIER